MNKVYLSLGSNRGNRKANLDKAMELLSEWVGNVVLASSVYETPPWKMTDKVNFFNQVLLIETSLPAEQLLDTLLLVESMMGRERTTQKYEPRIIDVDILFFNDDVIHIQDLDIPHPLIQERRFVLHPLAEIAPEFIHPELKKSITRLLDECADTSEIRKPVSK